MHKLMRAALLLIVSLNVVGCGATRHIRPLAVGNSDIAVSLGGPLVEQGLTFPAPYTVVSYAYGLHERLTWHAGVHPSAALYKVMVIEGGALASLLTQRGWIPELALNAQGILGSDFEEAVFFTMATLIGSYRVAQTPWFAYVGVDALWQFHSHENPWLPRSYAPLLGVRYQPKSAWGAAAEAKWLAASDDIAQSTLDFPQPFGEYGALGVYLMLTYNLRQGR